MVPKERINITIFTDGSCNAKSDRKLGGFGVYIPYENQEIHLRRGFWNTTTSRMEMKALLAAIQMIDPDVYTKVHVVADSEFVVNAFKKSLLSQWRANGWWGVKNPELWKEILKEIESRRKMVFGISHINGHGKDLSDPLVYGNACADALANYKTQDSYVQDRPLEGFSWFHHDGSDCVFPEKTEKFEELNQVGGDVNIIGDCFYANEEELFEWVNGTYLFEPYYNGQLDIDYKVEKI